MKEIVRIHYINIIDKKPKFLFLILLYSKY